MASSVTQSPLNQVAARIYNCQACPLHRGRKIAVPGEGPADAEIMFIGEGPGFHEDQTGRPFVGPAGKLLDELLQSIYLFREKVFITNVVRCRPPGNRDPQQEELDACRQHTWDQIAIINPKVIVTLGRFSMAMFFGPKVKISQIHGVPKNFAGQMVVPFYHPAAALHNPTLINAIRADFKKLPGILSGAVRPATQPVQEAPKQLTLI